MTGKPTSTSIAGKKIGLLGGSFNPAHSGHRHITLLALKNLGLDEVWWLVSPQNPLKSKIDMAPLKERVASARRQACHPRIAVRTLESELGTHYTADLLFQLRRKFPRTHFVWLMGADNMRQIPHWKDWLDIFRLVPVAVFRRPAYAAGKGLGKAAQRFHHQWHPSKHGRLLARLKPPVWLIMNNTFNSLSATDMRKDQASWLRPRK